MLSVNGFVYMVCHAANRIFEPYFEYVSMKESEKKVLYPFRRLSVRTRCFHRLTPEEVLVRKGF